MRGKLMIFGPLAIVGMAVFAFIGGEVVMLLWNWLMPPLFGLRLLTFWQALGLLALCRILFGGFRLGRGHRSNFTPEEKARFREGVRRKFGFGPNAGETPGGAAGQ
jgi:hypothetical protein